MITINKMKTIKVLTNQNKLCNEITSNARYDNQTDEFSIRMAFTGNEHYYFGNRNLNIYPGTFLVINKGTIFNREIYSDVPANTFSVLYSSQFLESFHRDYTKLGEALLDDPFDQSNNASPVFLETIYPFKGDMMYNLMHLKAHFDDNHHNDMLINEYLYYCLLNFYRLYKREILAKSTQLNVLNSKARTELFRRLNNAKDYMLSNYNRPLTIEEISRYACLSEIHFYRTFKQTYHISPYQYLIHLRLNNSRHMLKNTNYAVAEIVNLVGFDNPSSFIRLFRQRFGITPGNYRDDMVA